jgi:hypothetical protein
MDLDMIERRMQIREFIQYGDIDQAIEKINELDPEVCFLTKFGGDFRTKQNTTFQHEKAKTD